MVVFRGWYKKGNFRGIRKNRKNHISGIMVIAGSRMVIFQDHQKRGQISGPRKSALISGPPKIGRFLGRFFGSKNPIFRTWK